MKHIVSAAYSIVAALAVPAGLYAAYHLIQVDTQQSLGHTAVVIAASAALAAGVFAFAGLFSALRKLNLKEG